MPAISPWVAEGDALSLPGAAGFPPLMLLEALKIAATAGTGGGSSAFLPFFLRLLSILPSNSAVLLGGAVASSTAGRLEAGAVMESFRASESIPRRFSDSSILPSSWGSPDVSVLGELSFAVSILLPFFFFLSEEEE